MPQCKHHLKHPFYVGTFLLLSGSTTKLIFVYLLTQFFDKSNRAHLHRVLNNDSQAVISSILDVPASFILTIVKIMQQSYTLYVLSPAMLMWGPGITAPVYVLMMIMSWRSQRLVRGQAKRSANRAHSDTLETLQKIKTVRQFSMEELEISAFAAGNMRREALDMRRDTVVTLARIGAISTNWFAQAYLYYLAFTMVLRGDLTPTQGLITGTVGWLVTSEIYALNMLVTDKLFNLMDPLHALSALLDMEPRIESTETSTLLKVRETASELVIRDSFGYRLQYQD